MTGALEHSDPAVAVPDEALHEAVLSAHAASLTGYQRMVARELRHVLEAVASTTTYVAWSGGLMDCLEAGLIVARWGEPRPWRLTMAGQAALRELA